MHLSIHSNVTTDFITLEVFDDNIPIVDAPVAKTLNDVKIKENALEHADALPCVSCLSFGSGGTVLLSAALSALLSATFSSLLSLTTRISDNAGCAIQSRYFLAVTWFFVA
jgi:hypothetical protein